MTRLSLGMRRMLDDPKNPTVECNNKYKKVPETKPVILTKAVTILKMFINFRCFAKDLQGGKHESGPLLRGCCSSRFSLEDTCFSLPGIKDVIRDSSSVDESGRTWILGRQNWFWHQKNMNEVVNRTKTYQNHRSKSSQWPNHTIKQAASASVFAPRGISSLGGGGGGCGFSTFNPKTPWPRSTGVLGWSVQKKKNVVS